MIHARRVKCAWPRSIGAGEISLWGILSIVKCLEALLTDLIPRFGARLIASFQGDEIQKIIVTWVVV